MRYPILPSSEITAESAYLDRRRFLTAAGLIGAGLVGAGSLQALTPSADQAQPKPLGKPYGLQPGDTPTSWEDVTGYNNFYEFGTGKEDPAENAQGFRTKPWTVRVDGLVEKPGTYALEDFLKPSVVEDRIYRMRCVEGWSMVIPWRGIMLADVLKRAKPTSKAAFVEFTTLMDPAQMPGQRSPVLDWPYVEGRGCRRSRRSTASTPT